MPQMDFFPQRPEVHPMIYAYRDLNPDYDGLLKVGYTEKDVDRRVAQQYPTKRPDGKLPYEILYRSSAMREDGSCFTDHDVHRMLRRRKITGVGGEWFRCTVDELEAAVLAVKTDTLNEENRTRTFSVRPEHEEAVNKTIAYFRSAKLDTPDRAPKFLWNAKMRFGKTFAAYELARLHPDLKITALDQGRDVFAVPGPIDAAASVGCNRLIRDGAGLAASGWDILSVYHSRFPHRLHPAHVTVPEPGDAPKPEEDKSSPLPDTPPEPAQKPQLPVLDLDRNREGLTDDQLALIRVLDTETPLLTDEAAEQAGLPVRRVLSALTVLEIDGYAQRSGPRSYVRTVRLHSEKEGS